MNLSQSFIDAPEDLKQLAVEWPLCFEFKLEGGTVVVAGAYKGKVMDLLKRLYPEARIIGFEPQDWAAEIARARMLGHHNNWGVFPYGLGVASGEVQMGEWGTDACSAVNLGLQAREHGTGHFVEYAEAMWDYPHIDLMVLNMEGYEFPLLRHMLQIGALDNIDRLAVQWHTGLYHEGTWEHMVDLISRINGKMGLVYDHRPQWTYWVKPHLLWSTHGTH